MTTAFLIIFSLLIEYIYDPISNMKDTHVVQSSIEKYKEYSKGFFTEKYILYYTFPVFVFVLINIILLRLEFLYLKQYQEIVEIDQNFLRSVQKLSFKKSNYLAQKLYLNYMT